MPSVQMSPPILNLFPPAKNSKNLSHDYKISSIVLVILSQILTYLWTKFKVKLLLVPSYEHVKQLIQINEVN